MSDPSLDALDAAAQAMLDAAATPGPWSVHERRNGRDVVDAAGNIIADDVGDDAPLIAAAPDLARALVAAVDALRAEREARGAERLAIADALELQPIATHEQCVDAARVLSNALTNTLDTLAAAAAEHIAAATPGPWTHYYDEDAGHPCIEASALSNDRWRHLVAELCSQSTGDAALIAAAPDLARGLVAAVARIAAAEAQRDALAAATVEYLDAADADGLGNGEPTVAEYAAAQAARKRLDALLSGCAADVVRARVVRDFLRAVDAFEAAGIAFEMVDDEPDGDEDHDDALAEVDALRTKARDDLAAKRAALDAALAAAEGR